MSKNIIQNGSKITVSFSLIDEKRNVIFGDKKGKKEIVTLNDNDPLFDLFKCLIGKTDGFSGKFKVNQSQFKEVIEEYSVEDLPSSIVFTKGTIVKLGSSSKIIGFIKEVNGQNLLLETNKPFRHIPSILSVTVLKVD
jgi:FKBP-type peptidyl-prolyl cis-trans isomerase 2